MGDDGRWGCDGFEPLEDEELALEVQFDLDALADFPTGAVQRHQSFPGWRKLRCGKEFRAFRRPIVYPIHAPGDSAFKGSAQAPTIAARQEFRKSD